MEIKWKDIKQVKENNPEIDTIDQAIDEAVRIKRHEMWEEMYSFLNPDALEGCESMFLKGND